MPKGYRRYLPDQDLPLPPTLREWLAEEHLVYFVSDVVDELDLSAIHFDGVVHRFDQGSLDRIEIADAITVTKRRAASFNV